jgi:hypothetical protein
MRTTILEKLPLLTSRIHRSPLPNSSSQFPPGPEQGPHTRPPDPRTTTTTTTSSSHSSSEPLDGPAYPRMADEDGGDTIEMMNKNEDWNWPAAQARLAAAYERGGIAQFAEVASRELEAELELERRKRRIGDVERPP